MILTRTSTPSILTPTIDGAALARLAGLEASNSARLLAIVPAATKLLASRYGLILVPADFVLSLEKLPTPTKAHSIEGAGRISLPIGPVAAIAAVEVAGVQVDGWWLQRGQLFFAVGGQLALAGKHTPVTVRFMAGLPTIPHLVMLALAMMCRHGMDKSAEMAAGDLGDDKAAIEQYLEPHSWHGGGRVARLAIEAEGDSWLS